MIGFLFGDPAEAYIHAMDTVTLPPELERFAEDAVAAGDFGTSPKWSRPV